MGLHVLWGGAQYGQLPKTIRTNGFQCTLNFFHLPYLSNSPHILLHPI